MRIRECEIAAHRPHASHTHIRDVLRLRGHDRAGRAKHWRALHRPVSRRGSDDDAAILRSDPFQTRHALEIDEMCDAQQTVLEQEQ
jgi:hypothetical protein